MHQVHKNWIKKEKNAAVHLQKSWETRRETVKVEGHKTIKCGTFVKVEMENEEELSVSLKNKH